MPKMDDAALKALIASRRGSSSISSTQGDATARVEALKFYRGDPLGNEEVGMSSVVSRDTMEAVESMLPGLLRPFVSGDETVRFEPQGPEDEDAAKQATEYINYLFHSRNKGFRILYDSMKDGLLFRHGIGKAVWEEGEEKVAETYEGLDEPTLQALEADKTIEVGEITQAQDTGLFGAKVVRTGKTGAVKVSVVPPDQFLYERQLACLDDGTYFGERFRRTVAELIDMGLPKDKCLALGDDEGSYVSGTERQERFQDEAGTGGDSGAVDGLSKHVWATENYIKCDYDGNGALVWRRVFTGNEGDDILSNEECDGHPYFDWTPIPVPHKLVGLSIHDQVRDIQLVKTGVMREVQNGLYLANRPQREVVEGQVNIDDLLVPRIGGIVRTKAPNMVQNLTQPFDVGTSMSVIEYYDGVRESRTGSTRYNQGMDANSLNKTATGISLISNASHAREELIARQYAESFLKGLFRRMLELVCKHQDKAAVIRLRGTWVKMDPREWSDQYDMSVTVGLGTGNRQEQIGQLQQLIGMDAQIVQLQGGVNGPLLTMENVYEKFKRLVEAMGFKGIENYYTDPAKAQEQPQQPEKPDPAMLAHQAEQQQAQQQAQLDAHNAEMDRQADITKAQIDAQTKLEVARINAEAQIIVAGMQPPLNLVPSSAADDEHEEPAIEPQQAPQPPVDQQQPEPQPEVTPEMLSALQAHFSGQQQPLQPSPDQPPADDGAIA